MLSVEVFSCADTGNAAIGKEAARAKDAIKTDVFFFIFSPFQISLTPYVFADNDRKNGVSTKKDGSISIREKSALFTHFTFILL